MSDKILDRIRKLLALAANNPNEHEAASAAERAQAMLAEYNLTLEDVHAHDVAHQHDEEFEFDDTIRTLSRPWRRSLGVMVARMYFCTYFFTFHRQVVPRSKRKCGYIRHDIHNFVGQRHNIEVTKLIYQYLTTTIERLAKQGAQSQPVEDRTSYQTSFQHACATRLCKRIADRVADAKAGKLVSPTTGTALVLYDAYAKAEVGAQAAIDSKFGKNAVTEAPNRSRVLNEVGYREGRAAGDKISLDVQVTASNPNVKRVVG